MNESNQNQTQDSNGVREIFLSVKELSQMVNDVYVCDDFKHDLYDADLIVSRGFESLVKGQRLIVACTSDASGFMYPIKNSPFVSMFTSMFLTPVDTPLSESKQRIIKIAKERFSALNGEEQNKVLEALPAYEFKFDVLDDEADFESHDAFRDSHNDRELLAH